MTKKWCLKCLHSHLRLARMRTIGVSGAIKCSVCKNKSFMCNTSTALIYLDNIIKAAESLETILLKELSK